jgi:hypothetical protein
MKAQTSIDFDSKSLASEFGLGALEDWREVECEISNSREAVGTS